jgi:hypothetical protein
MTDNVVQYFKIAFRDNACPIRKDNFMAAGKVENWQSVCLEQFQVSYFNFLFEITCAKIVGGLNKSYLS